MDAERMTGDGDVWRVDARSSLQTMRDDNRCPPLLRQVLEGTCSWQMRCETSVERALVARRLAPEWLAALMAFGAHAVLGEEKRVSLEDLSGRREGGVIRALLLPLGAFRWGMARVARTEADAPIVSAVAVVRLQDRVVQDARVALTGVSPEAVCVVRLAEALGGEALDEEGLSDATAVVAAAVDPQGDYLGSVEYRRAMAEVLARRALAACLVGHGG